MKSNGSNTQTEAPEHEPSTTEALEQLLSQVRELSTYAVHFLSATVDGVQLSIRHIVVRIVLGLLGAITVSSVLVTATVLLLTGIAGGVAVAFDAELWVGKTIVGFLLLLIIAMSVFVGVRLGQRNARHKKVQQYAERQLQQRATFGRNVADRATDATVQHQE